MNDLTGLNALLAIADNGSFTKAAIELAVTPSAVSQTIRALEERVGVRLLQRTTRNVSLTEAGARFVAKLKPALDGVHEAFESIGELRDRPAGVLRLTLSRAASAFLLEPKLRAFLTAYPEITLDIDIDDALSDIVLERYDAGIRIGEMVSPEMIGARVSEDLRMVVVGAPSYFATRRKPKHPRDLHAHDCIRYRRRSVGTVYRWEFTDDGKELEIAVNGRMIVNHGELMTNAAVEGLGLAYVLEESVRSHVEAKRLVRVLDAYCTPFPGFYLYYPSRTHVAPKLRALVDFLKIDRTRSKRARPSRR